MNKNKNYHTDKIVMNLYSPLEVYVVNYSYFVNYVYTYVLK